MIKQRIPVRLRKPMVWVAAILALIVILKFTMLGPTAVQTVTIAKRDLTAQVYGSGTVEAKVVMPVSSKVTGRIEALYADQGDTAVTGQVLAKLEDEDFQQQVLAAQAGVKKAEAALAVEEANHQKAQANLELADKNFARIKAMGEQNLVSQQEIDEQATILAVAKEELERTAAAMEAAKKDWLAMLANQAFAESRKNDMLIVAPHDGIIISRDLEKGATVAPGLPIFRIADPAIVWVAAYVDESLRQGLAEGQEAAIFLRSSPKEKLPGRVARICLESDRVTEEIEVDVIFDPPLANFHLAEQAEVYIVTGTKQDAPSLPAEAVISKGKRRSVWLVDNGKLRMQEIVTGIADRSGWVEVESGIDIKSAVAIAPPAMMINFKDGLRVKIKR